MLHRQKEESNPTGTVAKARYSRNRGQAAGSEQPRHEVKSEAE